MTPRLVVVYNKETKELLACIPLKHGGQGILNGNIDFKFYGDSEPCFTNDNGVMKVSDAFTIEL